MIHRPVVLSAVLALGAPALATELPTCEPDTQTYDLTNYNTGTKARVIWTAGSMAPGCRNNSLFSMSGGEMWHNEALTDGGITGAATLVQTGCEAEMHKLRGVETKESVARYRELAKVHSAYNGSVWKVKADLIERTGKTGVKGKRGDYDDWDVMLVKKGTITGASKSVTNHRIEFVNYPYDGSLGLQWGVGANPVDKDASDYGGAFWCHSTHYALSYDSDYGTEKKTKLASSRCDFNFDLDVSCEMGETCPVDVDAPLGPASDFNVYAVTDLNGWNSDIGGPVAVGDNATFEYYGINSKAVAGLGLAVGGTLTATDAQLYGTGGGEAYGLCKLTRFGTPNSDMDCSLGEKLSFDAGSEENLDTIDAIMDWTAALEPTGKATLNEWWPQIIIDGDNDTDLNVVNLDVCALEKAAKAKWSWASNFQGIDIKTRYGATLVINVAGDCGDWLFKNGYISGSSDRSKILWAFHDMTSLTVKNVGVQGTVLMPYTDLYSESASFDGKVIAHSFKGSGEPHSVDFDGDICPAEEGE